MEFIEHQYLKVPEKMGGVGIGDHQCKLLRRGDENVGWRRPLAPAFVGRSIAGASLNGDIEAHLDHRFFKVAGDVDGKRLERRNVERVYAASGGRCGEIDEAWKESGERLAAAGRSDQQDAVCSLNMMENRKLMVTWLPTAVAKPPGKGLRQLDFIKGMCHVAL